MLNKIVSFLAFCGRRTRSRYVKWRRRWNTRPNRLMRVHRLNHIRFIDKPVVFVSQVQRSGGNLMARLFDGHPQLYAHPHELSIGRPNKYFWPKLKLQDSPEKWFLALREDRVLPLAETGSVTMKKGGQLPFLFSQNLQKEIFLKLIAERKPTTQRQILDCYITSYFNAWLDYQGLYRDPDSIKYWSVFTARMSVDPEQCDRYVADYPDGYLISIIRDPFSWFASARRHSAAQYGDIKSAIELWKSSAKSCVRNFAAYPGRVVLLDFDRLIGDTEGTMRRVCAHVDLDFHESLTRPTFNGLPISANSSFGQEGKGKIVKEVTTRGRGLSEEEIAYIEAETNDIHREALALTRPPAAH